MALPPTLTASVVRTTVTVLALAGSFAVVPASHAASTSWTTVSEIAGAQLQLCKTTAKDGEAWRVFVRVNAKRADDTTRSFLDVTRNGDATGRSWKSGEVPAGTVTAVGSVLLPRGRSYGLEHRQGATGIGGGGTATAAGVGRC